MGFWSVFSPYYTYCLAALARVLREKIFLVVLCLFPLSLVNMQKKQSADSRIELKIRQGNKFSTLGHRCFVFVLFFVRVPEKHSYSRCIAFRETVLLLSRYARH